jgi:hypothetical protein
VDSLRQYLSRKALDIPLRGGDKSAPNPRNATQCNPFNTDIYYLGNLVRQEFILVRWAMEMPALAIMLMGLRYEKYNGFEFMQDLVDEMTQINRAKRPFGRVRCGKIFSPLQIPKRIQASVPL